VVSEAVVAVPGDLATPTGGFGYDRRIVAELRALGWKIEVLDLGTGFPWPTAHARAAASKRLPALPRQYPIVIDGLAFGALPEIAEMMRQSHRLLALVHHPLALETGLSAAQSAQLRVSEQAALLCARHVVATSAATVRILAAEYALPAERLSAVEPGTDAAVANQRHAREGVVTLLSVGAVVPRKGYDVLIAALAKIQRLPWRLVIVGDCTRSPVTLSQLQADMTRLGLTDRIIVRGIVTADELASLYASSDLFVLPSRFEGYGMAFSEAIAHGLPVVGTTAGALAETLPRNASVLVPVGDAEALAQALERLIEQPQERDRLIAGARAVTFPSWREQGARFARILEALA
jgi:glycosyltransferase involved in cell wall biosynthesis